MHCRTIIALSVLSLILFNTVECQVDQGIGRFNIYLHSTSAEKVLYFYNTPDTSKGPFVKFTIKEVVSKTTFLKTGITWRDSSIIYPNGVGDESLIGLEMSQDSHWIKISLNRHRLKNPPTAWLYWEDAKKMGAVIRTWDQYFESDWDLYFSKPNAEKFYSGPFDSLRVRPKLSPGRYNMRMIKKEGEWMQIYLYSPTLFLSGETVASRMKSSNPPKIYWIKYLNEDGYPVVWYESE